MAGIAIAHVNGQTLVRVVGEIDLASAHRLDEALQLLDGPLTIDCSQLDFIDVVGLGVLAKASRDHDGVILRNASPFLRKLITVAGLESALHADGCNPEPNPSNHPRNPRVRGTRGCASSRKSRRSG
jgi:anti-anti-sigma factor